MDDKARIERLVWEGQQLMDALGQFADAEAYWQYEAGQEYDSWVIEWSNTETPWEFAQRAMNALKSDDDDEEEVDDENMF